MRKFIIDNKISFEEGSRNSAVVILIGYAQHLGLSKEQLEAELSEEIEADNFIQDEINRLWDYCSRNQYNKFWKTEEAKKLYKF
jgi:hypothetical protein